NPTFINFEESVAPPTPASPYPTTIDVDGLEGGVLNVVVTITFITHARAADVDVLLVSPTGVGVILMSDVTSETGIFYESTLTFEDGFRAIPNSAFVGSGRYRPTNSGGGDTFPGPAPGGPYGETLATFEGTDPNGTWSLFLVDDSTNGVTGVITEG